MSSPCVAVYLSPLYANPCLRGDPFLYTKLFLRCTLFVNPGGALADTTVCVRVSGGAAVHGGTVRRRLKLHGVGAWLLPHADVNRHECLGEACTCVHCVQTLQRPAVPLIPLCTCVQAGLDAVTQVVRR